MAVGRDRLIDSVVPPGTKLTVGDSQDPPLDQKPCRQSVKTGRFHAPAPLGTLSRTLSASSHGTLEASTIRTPGTSEHVDFVADRDCRARRGRRYPRRPHRSIGWRARPAMTSPSRGRFATSFALVGLVAGEIGSASVGAPARPMKTLAIRADRDGSNHSAELRFSARYRNRCPRHDRTGR